MPNSKNVLVTGGAGYIGSHTVVALAESGYQPVILDDFSNSSPEVIENLKLLTEIEIKHYQEDCCDENAVIDIMQGENIGSVIHFAASKAVGESVEKPLHYYHNNLNSLLAVLRGMQKLGLSEVVFSSSCTVYGQPQELPVTENSPLEPAESPYGNTKKICEDIIRDAVESGMNLKGVSLRYFNPIGAHASAKIGELPMGTPNNLVPYITQTAAGLYPKLTIFGGDYQTIDGTCIRDYIHVMDLAEAHVKALDYLGTKSDDGLYEVFNLGTGSGNTVLQVVETFAQVNDRKLNYEIGPRRPGDVEQIYASVNKAETVLNWKTKRTLEQALMDSWNWQQSLSVDHD